VDASVTSKAGFATAKVGCGCVLDSRRALYHEEASWLALADLHFGYELNRARQHGALLPQWGMAATERRLMDLLAHYKPRSLILVGDIMDGGGSVKETVQLINRLRECVAELICVEGNHDRPALRREAHYTAFHVQGGFCFQHGHKFQKTAHLSATLSHIHITGHEHPTFNLSDGAGLKLRLPALVQQRRKAADLTLENWILPAFSPWAGGAAYDAGHEHVETWGCSDSRILRRSQMQNK
jgi:uncharacterized protein